MRQERPGMASSHLKLERGKEIFFSGTFRESIALYETVYGLGPRNRKHQVARKPR